MGHVTTYDIIKNKTGEEALKFLINHDKIKIKDISIKDLISDNNEYYIDGHGLYLFFNNLNKLLYVGKCQSRNFVERIPDHFSLAEESWMNYLLKKIRDNEKTKDLISAYSKSLNYQLLLIRMKEGSNISGLESYIRRYFRPKYNSTKEPNNYLEMKNKIKDIII